MSSEIAAFGTDTPGGDSFADLLDVDVALLLEGLRDDDEFRLASRYLSCRIRLAADEAYLTVVLRDGVVVEVRNDMTGFDPYDIVLHGPAVVWRKILEPVPVPFFQDFWSARFMHGFRIEGDLDTLCAYYGAVRRIGDVLRHIAGPAATPSESGQEGGRAAVTHSG